MFRSSVLDAVGGFDPELSYVIDVDLWCRILKHGDVYGIQDPLCAFRISATSWSVALCGGHRHQYRHFLRRMCREPSYGLRRRDVLQGTLRCALNEIGRAIFYQLLMGTRRFANR
jgi:hypothetical protein